jgi:IMP cyclohydrolase
MAKDLHWLRYNTYPGRGLVIGMTPNATAYVQVYWIMGRSENSRNRIFVKEDNGFIKTQAHDPAKVKDPSLIMYYPVKHSGDKHIVSNGDQTDTIAEHLRSGSTFEAALATRQPEPDAPNYTPRISGILHADAGPCAYQIAVVKSRFNDPQYPMRAFFNYEKAVPGIGHCVTTYENDGAPLPSFQGEPFEVPLADSAATIADHYWSALNADNRISLLVKLVRIKDREVAIEIINRYRS